MDLDVAGDVARARQIATVVRAGGLQASDQLDDNVRVGREHFVQAVGPANVRGKRSGLLALHVAITNRDQPQRTCGIAAKNLGH